MFKVNYILMSMALLLPSCTTTTSPDGRVTNVKIALSDIFQKRAPTPTTPDPSPAMNSPGATLANTGPGNTTAAEPKPNTSPNGSGVKPDFSDGNCGEAEFSKFDDRAFMRNSKSKCVSSDCYDHITKFKKPVRIFGEETSQLYTFAEGGYSVKEIHYKRKNLPERRELLKKFVINLRLEPGTNKTIFTRETPDSFIEAGMAKNGDVYLGCYFSTP